MNNQFCMVSKTDYLFVLNKSIVKIIFLSYTLYKEKEEWIKWSKK